ncbi:TetR/AcrR family transcriptional regulator [Falsiroseomonas sp. HW251]|uniref:TetR/AcrR family transcriptional regulator n=1 Tax=Falsiroseomonas sp. HW251 TaxID=3390998 RepID=UPI003D313BE3
MSGRPREFDRGKALEDAMRAFWAGGYERTGLPELQAAMGIGRQSLYNTFGDKRSLFLEALDHYGTTQFRWLHERLAAPGSGLANVRSVLGTWVDAVTAPDFRGCLVCNSTVEFGRDAAVTAITERHNAAIEASFRAALERAVGDGELRPGTDAAALAQFLANLGQGLALQGRGGLGRGKAAAIVGVAEGLLDAAAA